MNTNYDMLKKYVTGYVINDDTFLSEVIESDEEQRFTVKNIRKESYCYIKVRYENGEYRICESSESTSSGVNTFYIIRKEGKIKKRK